MPDGLVGIFCRKEYRLMISATLMLMAAVVYCQQEMTFTNVGAIWVRCRICLERWTIQESLCWVTARTLKLH